MLFTHRLFVLIGALIVFFIFYASFSWSSSPAQFAQKKASNADFRLMRWLEIQQSDPQGTPLPPFKPEHAYDPPAPNSHRIVPAKHKPIEPFNPFPLTQTFKPNPTPPPASSRVAGAPAAPTASPSSSDGGPTSTLGASLAPTGTSSSSTVSTPEDSDEESTRVFEEVKFDFQWDVEFVQPSINLSEFATYRPHNYDPASNDMAFATYICTRNSSIHDPYFAAVQQLIWRNLWSPTSASKKYPFIVFVAPFITQEQRDLLAGAGAWVRELDLVEWEPPAGTHTWGRWRDLFSKLHMWNQTDLKRIAFMDSDAFPIQNIDSAFEDAVQQHCDRSKMDPVDQRENYDESICDYTFSGSDIIGSGEINVGFMVLEPNKAMHKRLLKNMARTDSYNNDYAEQAFLNWQFNKSGAFPLQTIGREYNGFFPQPDEEHSLKVVHEKLWTYQKTPEWIRPLFKDAWDAMIKFYDSDEFRRQRELDGEVR